MDKNFLSTKNSIQFPAYYVTIRRTPWQCQKSCVRNCHQKRFYTQTDGWLLTRVASRIDPDPHKLRRFARLLGIDDDTYRTIRQQAELNGQGIPLNVSSLFTSFIFRTKMYGSYLPRKHRSWQGRTS